MRYLSRGVFYKEFKIAKWFLLLLTGGMLSLLNLPFINDVNSLKNAIEKGYFNYDSFKHTFDLLFNYYNGEKIIIIIFIIFFSSFIVGSDYQNKKYEFLVSLPYKREEIIVTKYMITLITIFISFTISFMITLITFENNRVLLLQYLGYSFLFRYYIINLLCFIFAATFTIFIQTLCGKNILGGIFAGIFLILPRGLNILLQEAVRIAYFTKIRISEYEFLNNICNKMNIAAYKLSPVSYGINQEDYMKYSSKIIILTALILILIFILIQSFKHLPFERIGYISIYNAGDVVLKIGISFCFSLLAADIMAGNLTTAYGLYEIDYYLVQKYVNYTLMYSSVCFVVVGIFTYYITDKIIKFSKY